MSVPAQHAAAEFIHLLNLQQRNKFEASLSYTRGRFNYLAGNYSEAKEDLFLIIKNGRIQFALKAMWMVFVIQITGN